MAQTTRRALARLVDEPLLLFIIAGALLYGASALLTRGTAARATASDLVISGDFVRGLEARLSLRHGRKPTRDELRGELRRFLETELYYREALRLGLDRGDVIVRRRLAQKMRFVAEDFARLAEPSARDLRRYLVKHAARYRRGSRIAFTQRFIARSRGAAMESDARALLDALRAGRSGRADAAPVAAPKSPASAAHIARRFGERFAAAVARLESGTWHGPFASAYGLHVVRVERRVEGRDATLAEVRSKVRADLLADRERAAQRRFVTRLERRFGVRYDAAAKAHLGFDLPATKTRLASAPAAVGAAVAR